MLRSLTDVIIAFIELLEVEARALGRGVKQVGLTLAILMVAGALAAGVVVAGAGFIIWSLYLTMNVYFHQATAALLTGLAIWIVIGVVGWIAVSAMRRRSSK